ARLRFPDEHRSSLVQAQAAQLLGNVDAQKAQLSGLGQQLAQERVVFLLDPVRDREDLPVHEVEAGGEELALLLAETLRSHERRGPDRREEEVPAARLLSSLGKVLDLLRHVRS